MLDGDWDLRVTHIATIINISAHIDQGSISGSDQTYAYSGTISADDKGHVSGEMHFKRHVPGQGESANNLDEFTLAFTGTVSDRVFQGQGSIKGGQDWSYKIWAARRQ